MTLLIVNLNKNQIIYCLFEENVILIRITNTYQNETSISIYFL